MDILGVFLVALSLSADCLAVSICGSIGMGAALNRAKTIKVAAFFGLFQFGMILAGFLAGSTLTDIIQSFDHWIAFALLALIGGHMIKESFEKEEECEVVDISKGRTLVGLSVATSIDSLAAGLTFALIDVSIVPASVLVGITAFTVTLLGVWLGRRVGDIVGKRAELAGGLVLIGIGLKVLLDGLTR
ncbi:manganese efflux pump MntP family protein [Dehalogenimonas etheniformans]|uniref:Putative manganese efflux pump MntP n=1 Tax=Dehalogenimonas etheniformans TaxID=1536648 RepID=A0A2P5P922_9CHLR|nr:manganese efflux pump MntP family protein [Dehalogenimonas etheniformans]PPD58797.1 manganese efflux pump [Dehalogenimonas etheniformans]QNT76433.1 manganese efflux pump [Dehalogenimonas etheniformans]